MIKRDELALKCQDTVLDGLRRYASSRVTSQRCMQRHPDSCGVTLQREQRRIACVVVFQPRQHRPSQPGTLFDVGQRQAEPFPFRSQSVDRLVHVAPHHQPRPFPGSPFAQNLISLGLHVAASVINSLRFLGGQRSDDTLRFLKWSTHRLQTRLLATLRFDRGLCTQTRMPEISPCLWGQTQSDGSTTGCAEPSSRSTRTPQTPPAPHGRSYRQISTCSMGPRLGGSRKNSTTSGKLKKVAELERGAIWCNANRTLDGRKWTERIRLGSQNSKRSNPYQRASEASPDRTRTRRMASQLRRCLYYRFEACSVKRRIAWMYVWYRRSGGVVQIGLPGPGPPGSARHETGSAAAEKAARARGGAR